MSQKRERFNKQVDTVLSWFDIFTKPKSLKKDILSGITVALVLIPQSMAYAGLAGLPIEVGLYSSFLPIIVASLFGSAGQMSTGPVTIVSLMTATALGPLAVAGTDVYVAYASLLAFFIGVFYILLGNLKMGVIVDFLSHPVILGFTNAVAMITIISQLPKIFGIEVVKGGNLLMSMIDIVSSVIHEIHLISFVFGLSSIVFLFVLSKFIPKTPKILIVLIISISVSYFIGYNENFGGQIVLHIPSGLPELRLPIWNEYTDFLGVKGILKLGIFAMIIGLIGFTESVSVAKLVGYKTKQRISANKELIGQGLANISSSLVGGYAVAGSFSKTAVNLRGGAKTGFSSVVSGAVVVVTLLFFTPLLYHLPVATLGGIVIFAVASLIKVSPIIKAWKIEKHDAMIAIITFVLTIVMSPDLEKAIFIGAGLSLALYIYRTMRPKITEVSMYKDGELRDVELFGLRTDNKISVIRFDGTLYFANASYLEGEVLNLIHKKDSLEVLIIDLTWMNNIDSTGQEVFENLIESLMKLGIRVYICGIRAKVVEKFVKIGFLKYIGDERVFKNVEEVLNYIEKKYGKQKYSVSHLKSYFKDKTKEPQLEKKVIKNIG